MRCRSARWLPSAWLVTGWGSKSAHGWATRGNPNSCSHDCGARRLRIGLAPRLGQVDGLVALGNSVCQHLGIVAGRRRIVRGERCQPVDRGRNLRWSLDFQHVRSTDRRLLSGWPKVARHHQPTGKPGTSIHSCAHPVGLRLSPAKLSADFVFYLVPESIWARPEFR